MMFKFNLITRISTIVFVALVAIWLIVIGILFPAYERREGYGRPTADQIASLVELIERTPAEDRPLVLNSVRSAVLEAKISPGTFADASPDGKVADRDNLAQAYTAALKDRPFAVTTPLDARGSGLRRWLPWAARPRLEFRISLRTGDTLVLDSRVAAFITSRG